MRQRLAGQEVLDFDRAEVLFVSVLRAPKAVTFPSPIRSKTCASHGKVPAGLPSSLSVFSCCYDGRKSGCRDGALASCWSLPQGTLTDRDLVSSCVNVRN